MKNLQALGEYISSLVEGGTSFNRASRELGISPAEFHALRHGKRQTPNPAVLLLIANKLKGDYARMMSLAGFAPVAEPQAATVRFVSICIYEGITEDDFMAKKPDRQTTLPMEFVDGRSFIFVVPDDRMAGSRILKGDRVLVKVQRGFKAGDVCCVLTHPHPAFLCRVLRHGPDKYRLVSEHQAYPEMVVDKQMTRVLGVVKRIFIKMGE